MRVDRYPAEDVFARVPELANQTDPVLVHLDSLLSDDRLYQQVRGDLARRYPLTRVHGRHSTPAEVILRLLVVQHLYAWSYAQTVDRVADSLVLRWFCRLYFQRTPDATTLLRWAATIRPDTVQALNDRVAVLAQQARVTQGRKLRLDSTCVQTAIHHPTDSGLLVDGSACSRASSGRPGPWSTSGWLASARHFAPGSARSDARCSTSIAYDDAASQRPRKPSSSEPSTPHCWRRRGTRCARRSASAGCSPT